MQHIKIKSMPSNNSFSKFDLQHLDVADKLKQVGI
jgi:hypothetical protein